MKNCIGSRVCIGEKFNRLTLINFEPNTTINGHYVGTWQCDCGTIKDYINSKVKSGHSKSCGCLQREKITGLTYKHGYSRKRAESVEYKTWQKMKNRCYNPNDKDFKHYGGRGIFVSKEWLESFINFITDMGHKPIGFSLERVNVELGYSKENCIWIPKKDQAKNKRTSIFVLYKGNKMCLSEACKKSGMKYSSILYKIRSNKEIPNTIVLVQKTS